MIRALVSRFQKKYQASILWWSAQTKNLRGLTVAMLFAGFGAFTVLAAHAEKIFIMIELDTGTLSQYASVVKDASAAGGQYVVFSKNPPPSTSAGNKSTASGGQTSQGSTGGSTAGGNSGECAPFPSFPDANCTGPKGTLALYTGSLDIYTDGTVIENVEIRLPGRGLYVPADNVTFRNVKIVFEGTLNQDFAMVNLNNNSGTVFEDCELDGQNLAPRAIIGQSVTVKNCEIHRTGNAIEADAPLNIVDNYIHDIWEPPGTGPDELDWHADGIQAFYAKGTMTIRHNSILMKHPSTAAINVNAQPDSTTNILVEHNLMAGGGATIYAKKAVGVGSYQVINNHYSTMFFPKVGYYFIWYYDPSEDNGVIRSGNVIHETGASANVNI